MIDESKILEFLNRNSEFDSAHDLQHIRRVVGNARKLLESEPANPLVVITAAWLHDCINVPKDSPDRKKASLMSADAAIEFLRESDLSDQVLEQIHHAIHAHSYSAAIPCKTIEAQLVQDADRLDALGAVGLARCFSIGGLLNLDFYQPEDPFCENRMPDDQRFVIDHFFEKLLRLPETMQTASGRAEARKRAQFLESYLDQLRLELPSNSEFQESIPGIG